MATDAPLSELCSICYTEKPKYKCPRCKTRTCSLPCYKKHQERAACNGKRNPAEYLKKSQLTTPTGFDRDYNFLKGVEDGIDHAHRDSAARGTDGDYSHLARAAKRSIHPDSKLQTYFNTNKIMVDKAPMGMSRQKRNKTRRSKRDHIMWTVEWVDQDGKSEIQDHCLESDTLEALRAHLDAEKRNAERRKLPAAIHTRKRKADETPLEGSYEEALTTLKQPTPSEAADPIPPELTEEERLKTFGFGAEDLEAYLRPPSSSSASSKPEPQQTQWFYLLKVGTPSTSKVLIPIDQKQSLTKALQNQVVLEFPTIYIFDKPKLPEGFVLEKDYRKARRAEERELKETVRKAGKLPREEERKKGAGGGEVVDANKLLDMLKRDVTR